MPSFGDLDPRLQPWARELYLLADRFGMRPKVTSTRRSFRQQQILFEIRARVLAGSLPESAQPFPVAAPGTSTHELGLAFDMVVQPVGAQTILGDVWRGWGGVWFSSDIIHYQVGPDQLRNRPKIVTTAGVTTASPISLPGVPCR